jgi:hypothetical protein
MPNLPLQIGQSTSLEHTLDDDDNILHRLDYPQKPKVFWAYLYPLRSEIEQVVLYHLRV